MPGHCLPFAKAMAQPGPIERAIRNTLGLPFSLAGDPLVTGSLLLALTRAPISYQQRLLTLLPTGRIPTIIKFLKYLLAIGIAKRLNQGLTRLALNHWHLRKPGAPFQWGGSKSELVVITGGCSGFG